MTTEVDAQFLKRSELSSVAREAFAHSLKSVAPEQLVRAAVTLDDSKTKLKFAPQFGEGSVEFDLTVTPSILILGAGKATQELVSGLLHVLKGAVVPALKVKVQANYPKGQSKHEAIPSLDCAQISLLEASHPISDECTVNATNKQIEAIYNAEPGTLAIVLMSGGGSALYETTESFGGAPPSKISLTDLQGANKVLIESGANITEINIIRKHFSQVKGGRTAQHAIQSGKIAAVIGLYLSDVVGNDLSSVASGPTCPDVSTFEDCHSIISKYNLREKLPKTIIEHLDAASQETPTTGDPIFDGKVFNFLVGSADTSALAAANFLLPLGFDTKIFSNTLDGEASTYGYSLVDFVASKASQYHALDAADTSRAITPQKAAFIATGEFTVTIKGKGVGGRNQEMLLAFLRGLTQNEPALSHVDFAVLSCAFDGIEGNSPATGAIVDSSSLARFGASPLVSSSDRKVIASVLEERLANNDSFSVFGALKDDVTTGYTGTNVNDITMILLQHK